MSMGGRTFVGFSPAQTGVSSTTDLSGLVRGENILNACAAEYGMDPGASAAANTTAFEECRDALVALGGGTMLINAGTYQVNTLDMVEGVIVVGAGVDVTVLDGNSALAPVLNYEGTWNGLSGSTHVKNAGHFRLSITGTATSIGVNCEHASSLHMGDFRVDNVAYGIRGYGWWDSVVSGDVRIQECSIGIWLGSHNNDGDLAGVVDTNNIRFAGATTIESCFQSDIVITGKGVDGLGTGSQKPNNIWFNELKVESSFVQDARRIILESVNGVYFDDTLLAWTNYDSGYSTPVDGVYVTGESLHVVWRSPNCTNISTNVIDSWFYANGTDYFTLVDPSFLLGTAPATAHLRFGGTNRRADYDLDGLKLGPSYTPAALTISGSPTSTRQTYLRADGKVAMTDDLILSDGYAAASTNYVDTRAGSVADWKQKVIGGGLQSSVAVSPVDSARIAVQTDVGGLRVTVNGADWYGLIPPAEDLDVSQQGAAACWSAKRRDWLFVTFGGWFGTTGSGGLWLIQLPDDLSAEEPTWTRLDTGADVRVSSNSTVPAFPSGHPRPSGNLIALDEDDAPTTTHVFVGTADSGVWRYTIDATGTPTAETRLASTTATGLSIMGVTNRRQAQENSSPTDATNGRALFVAVHDDRFDRPFTSEGGTVDRIYDQAHGLSNNARIMFVANPPGSCTVGTSYFVRNRTTDYYQIASEADGTPITDLTAVNGHLTSNICAVSGSTITMTGHKLIAGTPIAFHFTSGNITAGTTYYVTNPATNTFQIATTYDGSALTFSGVGTHVAPYLDRLMWKYSTAAGAATAAELAGSPRNCYDVAYVAGNGLDAQRCVLAVNKDGAYVADTATTYTNNRFRFRNLVSGLTTNQEWGADGFDTTTGAAIPEFVAVTNCVVSRQTTGTITPYYGIKHAIRVRSSAGGDMEAATTSGVNGAPCETGDVLVAAIHTRANAAGGSGRTVKAGIIWYDSTGAQTGATTYGPTATTSNTTWTRLHVVGTAPAAAKYYAVSLHVAATGGASEDHILDYIHAWRVPATGETLAYKFEATAATNDFVSTAPGGHGFADGDRVVFTSVTGATGLSANTVYYVRDRSSNSFKVSTTLHGPVVDITATGTLVGICLDRLNGWPAAIAGAHLPQADRYAYVVGINDPQLMSRIGDFSSYGCAYVGLAPPNDPARVTWYRLDHHDVDWRDVDGTVMELAETDSAFGRNAWLPSNIAASPLAPYRFLIAGRVATMELHVNGQDRPSLRPVMRPTGASMNFNLHRGSDNGEMWASDSDWVVKRFFDYGERTSISGYKTVNAVISSNQTSRNNWFGPDGTLYIAGGNQTQDVIDAGNSIWAFTRPGDDTSAIDLEWRDGTASTDATGLPMGGATIHVGTQRIVVGAARRVQDEEVVLDAGGVFYTANLASAAPAPPAGNWTEMTTTASGGVNAMKVPGDRLDENWREDRAFFVWDDRSPNAGTLGHLYLLDRRSGIWRFDLTSTTPVAWASGLRICGWSGTVGDSAARDECSAMLRLDPNVPNRIWWSLAGSANTGLRYLSNAHTAGAATTVTGTNVWPAAISTELPGPFDLRDDGALVVATVGETFDGSARRNVRCYEVLDPTSSLSWDERVRLDDPAYRQVAWAPTDIRWDVDQQTVWVAPKGCGVLVSQRANR